MQNNNVHAAGGLYELCVGVTSLLESVRYFERFGFRVGPIAELDSATAEQLYGVRSAAKVVRLLHGVQDHGLIRLIQWESPINEGLGTSCMRAIGSRWSNNHTVQIGRIHGHAIIAKREGQDLKICPPGFAQFGHEGAVLEPFQEVMTGVYELSVFSDLYRQCFFERIDYPSPLFGKIDPNCFFQTSQITHCGITTSLTDRKVFDFYDRCLGLQRVLDEDAPYEHLQASRAMFEIPEGLGAHLLAFDEPRSGAGELKRSGRLLIFNFDQDKTIENVQDRSRAGVLGYSHFSWRVHDLARFKQDAIAFGAESVGDITADEFGTPAWACIAPDGYYWLFLQN